jgi:hypothetical protein
MGYISNQLSVAYPCDCVYLPACSYVLTCEFLDVPKSFGWDCGLTRAVDVQEIWATVVVG